MSPVQPALTAACLAAALTSFSPQAPAEPQQKKTVTVTGCLQPGTETGAFVLTNVTWDAPASSSADTSPAHHATPEKEPPSPPSASQPGEQMDRRPEMLRLAGSPAGTALGDHVGQLVSVTGFLVPEPRREGPATGTTGSTAPPSGDRPPKMRTPGERASDAAAAHILNVRSVTKIADSCTKQPGR